MHQKLVTIYLNDDNTTGIKEHLAETLNAGWRIVSLTPVGAGVGDCAGYVAGWLAVLLQWGTN